ncbi:pyruvate kinase [Denitromonas iodatirespirans]|uniref:Pyruvate kinase n=1 Tax=Denitromonas iodatirespirans TaxID=2795389 RepID=A0A944D7P6_DENI1|nr:pyruvate kinase [Denitromonas iodatirespirans]MBT0959548.1 pyruvate kinase [Denitromonas iodatirespirans]
MKRDRKAKILATLGPASSSEETIRALFEAGADVFRLNFSHGSHDDHKARFDLIRALERHSGRPVGVLADLQGPKLRVGAFADGPVQLVEGDTFRLDLDRAQPGDRTRVAMPHPEIFDALVEGTDLLLDDGRIRLRVERCGADFAETRVIAGGALSDRKGVNVPGVVLPLSALTDKDRADLDYALQLGVDWVALSFVQRPEDIVEIKGIVQGRAGIVAKLEKPAAIGSLAAIVAESDAIMVARGDLGVEMPPEEVPAIQKRIVRACRQAGRPVIVATQMLESMVGTPVPTRAEASDVATAIYDGADAVMLSAESASGKYPVEAVRMMDRIIAQTEADPYYHQAIDAAQTPPEPKKADAIGAAVRDIAALLQVAATVAYTSSGYSALRIARERPQAPVIGMTPRRATARRLALVWGVHAVLCHDVQSVSEMSDLACDTARTAGFGRSGDTVVIAAGMPFGASGTTNLLRIAQID